METDKNKSLSLSKTKQHLFDPHKVHFENEIYSQNIIQTNTIFTEIAFWAKKWKIWFCYYYKLM